VFAEVQIEDCDAIAVGRLARLEDKLKPCVTRCAVMGTS
jgi:hypothetical protein